MRFGIKTAGKPKAAQTKKFYRPGCAYMVRSLDYEHKACKQLIDMGITPNTLITIESAAPLGEPLVVKVRDYRVALRSKDLMALEAELQTERLEKAG